jgi:hypothetical protein
MNRRRNKERRWRSDRHLAIIARQLLATEAGNSSQLFIERSEQPVFQTQHLAQLIAGLLPGRKQ